MNHAQKTPSLNDRLRQQPAEEPRQHHPGDPTRCAEIVDAAKDCRRHKAEVAFADSPKERSHDTEPSNHLLNEGI